MNKNSVGKITYMLAVVGLSFVIAYIINIAQEERYERCIAEGNTHTVCESVARH